MQILKQFHEPPPLVTLKIDPEIDSILNQTGPSNDQDNGDSVSSVDSRTVLESDSDINNKDEDLRVSESDSDINNKCEDLRAQSSSTQHDIIPPDPEADVDREERKKLSDKVETMVAAVQKVCDKIGLDSGSLDKSNIDKYPPPVVMACRYEENAKAKLESFLDFLENDKYKEWNDDQKAKKLKALDSVVESGASWAIVKIGGKSLRKDVPYKKLLLTMGYTAISVVKEMLGKYAIDGGKAPAFCLVQSNLSMPDDGGEGQVVGGDTTGENILEDNECPLHILMNHERDRGAITFHVKRRTGDTSAEVPQPGSVTSVEDQEAGHDVEAYRGAVDDVEDVHDIEQGRGSVKVRTSFSN